MELLKLHLPFDWTESENMWHYGGGEDSELLQPDDCLQALEVAVDVSVGGYDSEHDVSDSGRAIMQHKCSFCGEEGHRRETCAKRKKVASRAVNLQTPIKSASRKGSEQVCSKCGGAGHNSRACKGGSRFKKK